MAIVCPPGSVSRPADEGAGWTTGENRWGSYITRLGTHHPTGINKWAKYCTLLGTDLYSWEKTCFAACAREWTNMVPGVKASWTDYAASTPFTNLKGIKKPRSAYWLFMHCAMPCRCAGAYPNFGWTKLPPGASTGQNFDHLITENDQVTPAIVDAHLYDNMTYSISLSNWDGSTVQLGGAAIYVSLPRVRTLNPGTLFQIDVAPIGDSLNLWTDGGRGIASCLMKPYPAGTECFLGIRAVPSYTFNGILPSPLAAELVTVEPAP